ncbi:Gfo/Idh/MocA family oxidoreductase [Cronbergia sp. UHCC 0137]|uniref:Gfo/Idh/MocA family protein n=1 Tax=Cronbergia sp. UHCC 0137 TaxID=3110239 RepID=UPI002B1F99A2|nr:Gfo/Idh/MocA family oxidoreductase [Cronbergia sp. UHCC 0137]MEA5617187.1 Gfo/Idh/MocA family oxidoreductase [Cronbergia sp. UHCC 0137]
MNKIGIAVIGVGRWGVHLLRNFLAHPQVIVLAIVDPNPERLTTVKQQFNLDENILLTTDWETVKQLPELRAIAIATPASTHYTLIKNALHHGYHVLAEKPLTLDPQQCRELCQLAENQNLILMVDHTYLFHPAVETGQNVVKSGKLGDLRYGYATRTHLGPVRQDVDALWDLAIHDLAIFNSWLGQLPVQVQATGKVWLQESIADLVWITLTYPNGFQVHIHLCWSNPDKQRRLGIVGSLGTLIFDEMSPSPLTFIQGEFARQEHQFIPVNQRQEVLEIEPGEPLQKVCDRFIMNIINHTPALLSSGWVGAELVEILTALTTSLNHNGQPISVI